MDNNLLLMMVVIMAISITLWRSIVVSSLRFNRGWVAVALLTAGTMMMTWTINPAWTGAVGLLLWAALVVLPAMLSRLIVQLMAAGRGDTAIQLARVLAVLHPADGYREQPGLLRAYQAEADGDVDSARALLRPLLDHPTLRYQAAAHYFRISGQYEALLAWVRAQGSRDAGGLDAALRRNGPLLDAYLRALAATGDLNSLLAAFDAHKSALEREPVLLYNQYLVIAAHTGRAEAVEALLSAGPLARHPEPIKATWRAVTHFAAGESEAGHALLDALRQSEYPVARAAAERLVAQSPVVAADALTPRAAAQADALAAEIIQATRYVERGRARPLVTLTLIAANLAAFAVELSQGGAENAWTLYQLGALYAPAVIEEGEGWRLFNAIFLHAGVAHLAFNMLALYVLGGFVEGLAGRARYLLIYFAAGIGSSAFIVVLYQQGLIEAQLYLGASGAIMGLVGATAAIYLRDLRRGRSRTALRGLRGAVMILGLQTLLDLLVPQTSLEGHLSGALIGFVVALALISGVKRLLTAR